MQRAALKPVPLRANPIRLITAASLFDGHDAAINIMRRLMQKHGAEVIHLGHNRSVDELVTAAIQEDAHGIAVSSYQGGHIEYFEYMVSLLKERGAPHVTVFGGGGGVILPQEVERLHQFGVTKIYTPQDGQKMGLEPMIVDLLQRAGKELPVFTPKKMSFSFDAFGEMGRLITIAENDPIKFAEQFRPQLQAKAETNQSIVVGITGTGGAGKSSLVDEWLLRWSHQFPRQRVAVVSIDPSKKKSGGALLGDRIRMNSLSQFPIMMRSMGTRTSPSALSQATHDAILVFKAYGATLILVETPGIGQGDSEITRVSDTSVYVMTPEFGAPSQLEKIQMLEDADFIVINKSERRGAEDAFRDVRKQYRRNHNHFKGSDDDLPVFGTIASQFNDPGVNAFFQNHVQHLSAVWSKRFQKSAPWENTTPSPFGQSTFLSTQKQSIVPTRRIRYLSEISDCVRSYHRESDKVVEQIYQQESLEVAQQLGVSVPKETAARFTNMESPWKEVWEVYLANRKRYQGDQLEYTVRGKTFHQPLITKTLSGTNLRRISLPSFRSRADHARFAFRENLPGYFPFTGGVFPLKRQEEDPKRMFAGEGLPEDTNKRFHFLCKGEKAKRLSTAFDSVTLYGEDPDQRPDIYGKIGISGVSIATLEDMKRLYDGFDLCDPTTSVSMTINGPAPMMLAFYFNTAIDQELKKKGIDPDSIDEKTRTQVRDETLQKVRGTVQADILKEDQAQNTCIFSTEFALKLMGDIQEYFVQKSIRNYYSVSISGYHIAEAGANPITQLALTLANGFTYVENYLARGLRIDDFAPNLSYFFSNGMDPEYTVIGRVARRIWAIAMNRIYGGSERSQKLKYHIQTSGRSLHAMEIQFNDIRTTLQALIAYYDHCNSLHTNAFDEAITTPTEESVRRAMAIQLIISKEMGLAKNENPNQGSFIISELTDLVEEAVLKIFDSLTDRGGVLGAMETMFQRNRIQEESLFYESLKDSGELPVIGVNTYLNPHPAPLDSIPVVRSSSEQKDFQIKRCKEFKKRNQDKSTGALQELKKAALQNANVFEALMEAARFCSLGQMTHALFEVGGRYRRSM